MKNSFLIMLLLLLSSQCAISMEDKQEIPLSLQEKIALLKNIDASRIDSIQYVKNEFAETYHVGLQNGDKLVANHLLSGPVCGAYICQYRTHNGASSIISAASNTIYQQLEILHNQQQK